MKLLLSESSSGTSIRLKLSNRFLKPVQLLFDMQIGECPDFNVRTFTLNFTT